MDLIVPLHTTERDAHYSHSVVVFPRKEYSEGVCTVSVPKLPAAASLLLKTTLLHIHQRKRTPLAPLALQLQTPKCNTL